MPTQETRRRIRLDRALIEHPYDCGRFVLDCLTILRLLESRLQAAFGTPPAEAGTPTSHHRPQPSICNRYNRSDRYGDEFFLQITTLHVKDPDFSFKTTGDDMLAVGGKRHGEDPPRMPLQFVAQLRVLGIVDPDHSGAS